MDLKFSVKLKKMFQKSKVYLVGHVVKILKKYIGINYPELLVSEKPIDNFIYNFINGNDKEFTLDDFPTPDYSLFKYENLTDINNIINKSLYE